MPSWVKPGTREMGAYFVGLPFVLGLLWLGLELAGIDGLREITLHAGPVLLGVMIVGLPVLAILFAKKGHDRPIARAALMLTLLSPLTVMLPWAAAPSHIGIGLGNFSFFVHWLTKYPNLGPINYEVLLGMLCVLGSATMPALYAASRLWAGDDDERSSLSFVLFVLHLVAYLPVLVRLDLEMIAIWGSAAYVFGSGALMRALLLVYMVIGVRGVARHGRVAVAVAFVLVMACDSTPPVSDDLRFHTPKATIDTLIETYGLEMVSQAEIRRRMQIGRSFHLVDPETRDLCFADFDGPEDEGMVGYVFGGLAPAKDDVRITQTGDVAHAFGETRDGRRNRPIVLQRDDTGAWRIVLDESVPADVRERLERVVEEGDNPLERIRRPRD